MLSLYITQSCFIVYCYFIGIFGSWQVLVTIPFYFMEKQQHNITTMKKIMSVMLQYLHSETFIILLKLYVSYS